MRLSALACTLLFALILSVRVLPAQAVRGIGDNGEWVQAFVCESWAAQGAEEITRLGGWRAYLAQKAAH